MSSVTPLVALPCTSSHAVSASLSPGSSLVDCSAINSNYLLYHPEGVKYSAVCFAAEEACMAGFRCFLWTVFPSVKWLFESRLTFRLFGGNITCFMHALHAWHFYWTPYCSKSQRSLLFFSRLLDVLSCFPPFIILQLQTFLAGCVWMLQLHSKPQLVLDAKSQCIASVFLRVWPFIQPTQISNTRIVYIWFNFPVYRVSFPIYADEFPACNKCWPTVCLTFSD